MGTEETQKYMNLYREIRENIVNGVYSLGSKLPSKRNMAAERNVSVITVEHAYEMLAEEGYIVAREKSGYFVEFSDDSFFAGRGAEVTGGGPVARGADRSGRTGMPAGLYGAPEAGTDMQGAALSFATYARTARHVMSTYGERILERSPGYGTEVLREAIAAYLRRSRSLAVDKELVVIGSGAEYLYGLIVKALGRDLPYGIEDPSYMKIAQVYAAEGATVRKLKLGRDGIESRALWQSDAGALHITPYRSFPSGVTASASKRREYLRWSEEKDSYIIEDDFESEFSPLRKPEETLFSLDRGGRVIYVNTFTRTIGPFVRVAYMVIPAGLRELFQEQIGFYACTVPVLDQYIVAELIANGSFERHINKVRRKRKRMKL